MKRNIVAVLIFLVAIIVFVNLPNIVFSMVGGFCFGYVMADVVEWLLKDWE